MSASQKAGYRFILQGEGIDVDRQVNQAIARHLLNVALAEGDAEPIPAVSSVVPRAGDRKSLREFLDEVRAQRNPEKIVAIGDYLDVSEKLPDFSREDIRGKFRAAGEAPPGNFGRDFAWAISNGWIAEDVQNKGRFYVTKTGKEAVGAKFSAEIKQKSMIKPQRRKRSPASKDS